MNKSNGLDQKIEELMSFLAQSGIDYSKLGVEIDFGKKDAYPNYSQYMDIPDQRNVAKWLQAVKDLYYKERNNSDRVQAIRQVTAGWDLMETYAFLNWLRFYEEGTHLKYKYAQVWYGNDNLGAGYFLEINKDAPDNTPSVSDGDVNDADDAASSELSAAEKKRIIERQRQKIIGRLDSVEKLLRSDDGQLFSGKEFETFISAIYDLKKKIHMVNKLSTSTKLYEDMIVRQANQLNRQGFVKSAEVLYAIANGEAVPATSATPAPASASAPTTPDPAPAPAAGAAPTPTPPAPPTQSAGAPGGSPSTGPGMPQTPPGGPPSQPPVSPGIQQFLAALDTAKVTTVDDKDKQAAEDVLEIDDELFVDEDGNDLMMAEAQAAPPSVPNVEPPAPVEEEPIEVEEEAASPTNLAPVVKPVKDFDSILDSAFANITVDDVVSKLEDLAKIFKTREIPRQLAMIDMMLDKLGIASFFPTLSEATNKSLESNNYISTRIEEIIAKLRGAMKTKSLDLSNTKPVRLSPEVEEVKEELEEQEKKERERKDLRKEIANQGLEGKGKETPEIEIEEDLGPTPPPAPVPRAPVPRAPAVSPPAV